MRTDKILFIDTETGGLDPLKNSLLSVGFVVWQNFKIVAKCEIFINDSLLDVTDEAAKINGFNKDYHLSISISPDVAIQQIEMFLNEHFKSNEKITLAGHNINFDVNFLRVFLINQNFNFYKRFSHRFIDTSTILYFLYLSNKISKKAISSQEAFKYFKIKVAKRHSALGDAIGTATLFSILLEQITECIPDYASHEKFVNNEII